MYENGWKQIQMLHSGKDTNTWIEMPCPVSQDDK